MTSIVRRMIVLGLLLGITGCAGGVPPQDNFQRSWRGRQAPDFRLELIDGETFRLSAVEGKKLIVLNFFGTWCPPCRDELPGLNNFYHENRDEVVLVGISLNEEESAVENFFEALDVDFPVGLDYEPGSKAISNRYAVPTLPTTVVINRFNRVIYYKPGMLRTWDFNYLYRLARTVPIEEETN